jgi:hypothetical protein
MGHDRTLLTFRRNVLLSSSESKECRGMDSSQGCTRLIFLPHQFQLFHSDAYKLLSFSSVTQKVCSHIRPSHTKSADWFSSSLTANEERAQLEVRRRMAICLPCCRLMGYNVV